MIIEPNDIVEGYIPVVYRDGNEYLIVSGKSNLGDIEIWGIEKFNPWILN